VNPYLFRFLLGTKHLADRPYRSLQRDVARNQWLSRDELAAITWERQKAIVRHAFDNCPFYRRKYSAAGFAPGDLKQADDFARLPILTKEELRSGIGEIVAEGCPPSRLLKKFTGGSTGIPVMVYHDLASALMIDGLHRRTIGSWGLKHGCRTAHIWGLNRLNEQYLHSTQSSWRRFLTNYVLLDAFDMTREKLTEFHDLLSRFRPELIISYTSAMVSFARFVQERGGTGLSPAAIWLTSEPTHEFQKSLVERVFQSTVFDQYGSVEVLFCASECSVRNGLHINSDFRLIEIADSTGRPLGPGHKGQVVVTDLANYAAPLIRYRNEDIASLLDRPCECGRTLPLMSKVDGRIYDMFVLPDGSEVYGHRFTTFFYDYVDQVRNFQVHQTDPAHAVVRIVATPRCAREELSSRVQSVFRSYTKGLIAFEILFVEEIPAEASGKYRFAKSDVRSSTMHDKNPESF
jgi:phenylacetate-CoA ligase